MQATSKQEDQLAGRADGERAAEARRSWRERALTALKESAWTTLGGKAAAYVAGFFALALVGSGHAMSLLPARRADPSAGLAMVAGGAAPLAAADQPPPAGGPPTGAPAADPAAGAPAIADAGAGAAAAGPAPPAPAGGDVDAGAPAGGGVTPDGKVVLNLATEADLRRLPGIGPAKAAAILALRARIKRFRKVDELLRVKGIGRRSLKRLRPLVVVDPP
ncbi:helix-hairpin-helix domain-containing protein [Sorangium sp. So ce1036]|uniref:ComEA family DNA-binding protein n=1 Tax=Sorangium sp. So ce1036 TaxID=3133328 RepID=UPI003F01691C